MSGAAHDGALEPSLLFAIGVDSVSQTEARQHSQGPQGTLRIWTWFGIPVYVHWSWAVVAVLQLQWRSDMYGGSLFWIGLEYIGLFGLVLLHEFGHALACKSVGGQVSHVLLWPLGGVAHVRPPQRPGALLWSIVAGPLVNLVLGSLGLALVIFLALTMPEAWPNLQNALATFTAINAMLFLFNMLPVHPLDGGQIVRALLWFVVGRDRSLVWTSAVGLVAGTVGGIAAWVFLGSYWIPLIAAYAVYRSWQSLGSARSMLRLAQAPKRTTHQCPSCGTSPPRGRYWACPDGHAFDPFEHAGHCSECDSTTTVAPCIHCWKASPIHHYDRSAGPFRATP
jgi:Zn-dependent protease